MKHFSIAILLAGVIFAPAYLAQSKSGTQNPGQKKTSLEKSSSSSLSPEKEKMNKRDETRKSDATEMTAPAPPISREEMLATSVALVLSIGTQAHIDDPLDKIRIMLESARLLTKIKSDDSSYMVAQATDLLLESKKKEQSEDGQKKIAMLERELIALFSKLDPEKAEKFIQDSLDVTAENVRKSQAGNNSVIPKARAEKMAELASILIDNGIPSGVDLLLNSVAETGRVANTFVRPFRTLVLDSAMKKIMSARITQAFSGKIVTEPNELSILAAPVIGITGRDDSCLTINAAILELELNSLRHIETTLRAAREQGQVVPYDNDALGYLCGLFTSSLREQYTRWLPGRLKEVDLCLRDIQESVSFKIGESREREKAATFEEKLDQTSGISSGSKRERELINLAFDVLNNRVSDGKFSRDQMVDKVLNALNSKESKTLVEDAKIITSIKDLVKGKNFLQAARDARRISRDDWRAQVLAGAASGLEKTDQEAAGLIYMEALEVLNNSKPGTAVIRTTLHIADRYYEKESAVGRQILNAAVRFANQTNFSEKGFRFPFDRSLVASIGSITFVLGFEPERIQDALRDFNIGKMVQSDWMVMYETSLNLENKMLRAIFQLKMCEAVINQPQHGEQKAK